jgi:hypothetical protein
MICRGPAQPEPVNKGLGRTFGVSVSYEPIYFLVKSTYLKTRCRKEIGWFIVPIEGPFEESSIPISSEEYDGLLQKMKASWPYLAYFTSRLMKTQEFYTMAEAARCVVKAAVPEFRDSVDRLSKRCRSKLNIKRQRADGLSERLYVEMFTERDECSIGMQAAVSYFSECPIPSGPFGCAAVLNQLVGDRLTVRLRPYWFGAGWYTVKASLLPEAPFFELLSEALRDCVRPALDEWATKLLSDDLLRIAVGTYCELEKSGDTQHAEETFSRKLDRIGPTSVKGYSVAKIKGQLLARLRKDKHGISGEKAKFRLTVESRSSENVNMQGLDPFGLSQKQKTELGPIRRYAFGKINDEL